MTSVEWNDEMRRTLAPHLETFRRELNHRWPSLDPEMVLLHWLCMKHNLEPPQTKLRRLEGAAHAGEEYPTPPHSARGTRPARRALAGTKTCTPCACGSIFMPDVRFCRRCGKERPQAFEWLAPQTARHGEVDFCKGRPQQLVPLALKAVHSAASTAVPAPISARSLDLGGNAAEATLLPDLPASARAGAGEDGNHGAAFLLHQQLQVQPKQPVCLRTLGRLNALVEDDVQRHVARSEVMERDNTMLTDMVANMRLELRGQFLQKVPLLSRNILTEHEQFRLVGKLRPWTFASGKDIIVEGEVGNKLYIIERGSCDVIKSVNGRNMVVGQLAKGAFFGEIAALYDIPRTATVRTTSSVTALSLARSDLMNTIGDEDLEKMRVIARTQVFSSIPLLDDLHADHKARIARALKKQTWRRGAIIAGENHITSRLYIVEHGHVMMQAKSKDLLPSFWPIGEKPTIELGPGGFFGMRGLLYAAPVGFDITAHSDEVDTLSISHEEILETAPPAERAAMEVTMKESMQGYLLRQIPQLKQMAEEYFSIIRAQLEEVTFPKWSVIFAKGQRIEAVYVLEKGAVMEHDGESSAMCELPGERECPPGANSKPACVTPGELFGLGCLTDKGAKAPFTLVALTDVKLLRVPQGAVWSVLHEERQHIDRIPLLSQDVLGKAEQYMLVGKLKPWKFTSGHHIIREGEIGDMLFVIERGVCDAIKHIDGREVVVSQLKKGDFFGELAVMYDMPRTASVRAATDVVAVSLSREDIFSTVPPEKIEKMRTIARTQVFNQIALLRGLDTAHKVKVAQKLRSDVFQEGAVIQREGQPTMRLLIIERGEVRVAKGSCEVGKKLAGSAIGELGLRHGEAAHFTLTAAGGEVKILSISLEEILETAGTGERPALERALDACFQMALLKQIPLLGGKSDEYLEAVLTKAEVVRYAQGDLIFGEGSQLVAAHVLLRGQVKATWSRAQAFAEAQEQGGEPVRIFGHECLSGAEARADFALHAATDCQVLRVSRRAAHVVLNKRGSVAN